MIHIKLVCSSIGRYLRYLVSTLLDKTGYSGSGSNRHFLSGVFRWELQERLRPARRSPFPQIKSLPSSYAEHFFFTHPTQRVNTSPRITLHSSLSTQMKHIAFGDDFLILSASHPLPLFTSNVLNLHF